MFRLASFRNQTGEPDTMPSENTVHIAIELSFSSWLVAVRLPGAKKSALHRIEGGNTGALLALIAELRSRTLIKLGRAVEVACCFEAGRDGFLAGAVVARAEFRGPCGPFGPASRFPASTGVHRQP